MSETLPILYSFRRCPYAMRARLAIKEAGFSCELREIVLRDKAAELLEASPKGTVPVLVLPDQTIVEESLEIMAHVLRQHDSENWLARGQEDPVAMALISENDSSFKAHLDRAKYAERFKRKGEEVDPIKERASAMRFINKLDKILSKQDFLGGEQPHLADMAILPFVRQFAHIDIAWFRAQPVTHVISWLDAFLCSPRFKSIMTKYDKWQPEQPPILFP
ncbi:MAG: glutathione S-transferase [Hyphomicrobiaceae bacterium]|nr:glutathione S-transferase [Hyphomicrobiaceae bacterium]